MLYYKVNYYKIKLISLFYSSFKLDCDLVILFITEIKMSRQITLDVSDEIYEFLQTKADETESIEMVAISYLEQGVEIEKTLRQ